MPGPGDGNIDTADGFDLSGQPFSGPGNSGGSSSTPPILPAPGQDMFNQPDLRLGAAELGGEAGSQVIINEVPGDLGSIYMTLNKYLLLAESSRQSASFNGFSRVNFRYRGHRESGKFNLMMQKLVAICARLFLALKGSNDLLQTREISSTYPTTTEISELYHVREQIEFKEWMLLKDEDKKWFV